MDLEVLGFSFDRHFYADAEKHRVLRDGEPLTVPLTLMEYDFLDFFLRHPDDLIEYADIDPLNEVNREGRLPVADYVAKINRKLGWQSNEIFVLTRGVGFTLQTDVRPQYAKDREKGIEIHKISEFNFNLHTIEMMRSSLAQSLEVLELNPHGLPEAHIRVAYNYINLGTTGYAVELADRVLPEAREQALKALPYPATKASAHGVLALISFIYDYDWVGAEKHFAIALDLNPDDAPTLLSYAHFEVASGKFQEAISAVERGARLKPEDRIIYASQGWIHTLTGDLEKGIHLGSEALSLHPGFPPGHVMLGWSYEAAGKDALALTQYELSLKAEYSPPASASVGHLYGKMGERKKALAKIMELETLHKRGLIKYVPAYCRALVYAGLQDIDRCLDELERAYDERCDWLMHLVLDKRWDPVRQTPRFKKLVSKVGIPYTGKTR